MPLKISAFVQKKTLEIKKAIDHVPRDYLPMLTDYRYRLICQIGDHSLLQTSCSKVKQFKQERSDRHKNKRTDRQKDGCWQVHYLPASLKLCD